MAGKSTKAAAKPTVASLAGEVADLRGALTEVVGLLRANATAAPVAEATGKAKGKKAAEAPAPEPVDPVQVLVDGAGLKFAKGGRAYLTLDAAVAMSRVLKTGTAEIVPAAAEKAHEARNVTHLVIFRTEAGNVAVQPLFKPAK